MILKHNEKKNKVGRPKLASEKTIKESFWVSLFCLIVIALVVVVEVKSFVLMIDPTVIGVNVYNNDVNICKINGDEVNCGANVTYASVMLGEEQKQEFYKKYSNISFNASSYDEIEVCYETNKNGLECVSDQA